MSPTPIPPAPISREDIEAKFRAIQGEAVELESEAQDYLILGIAAIAVAVVVVAFVLGVRRGRSRRTVVEIRRI